MNEADNNADDETKSSINEEINGNIFEDSDANIDSEPLDAKAHPYERLSPDLLIDAIESLGFLCDGRFLALNSYENRVYQIGIEESGPLIVKFYRPDRWSDEQIEEEHSFSRQLADNEIPVITPLIIKDKTLFEYQGFRFSLYPRQGGHAPELDNLDHLMMIGRFLARIHATGACETFQYRETLHWQTARDSSQYLLEHFMPKELQTPYATLCDDLFNKIENCFQKTGELELIRVHGDCHSGNMLWRADTPHFVDFDDTCMAPAIQDIWMLLSGDRAMQTAQLSEIAEGYNEFYDFPSAQLPLIESLRTLRIVNYSAWLAKRWQDPAFPRHFPWFNDMRYWSEHILELREQLAILDEPALHLF